MGKHWMMFRAERDRCKNNQNPRQHRIETTKAAQLDSANFSSKPTGSRIDLFPQQIFMKTEFKKWPLRL